VALSARRWVAFGTGADGSPGVQLEKESLQHRLGFGREES